MKTNFLFTTLFAVALSINSQGQPNWAWVGGSKQVDQIGAYGSQGVPATTNAPGGRSAGISWTDNAGNFWLFGGAGFDASGTNDRLNDLWRYDPATQQWTWMKGSLVAVKPGIYGTLGTESATNTPGSRDYPIAWTDATNNALYLFGGYGHDVSGNLGDLNDLWRYNISTGQWAWLKGTNSRNANGFGTYGTKGTASATNTPGSRREAVSWTDVSGNFWMFGGLGYDGNSPALWDRLNDLWVYNKNTNQWTWVNGEYYADKPGSYGTQGTPTSSTFPGARQDAVSWTDKSGNLWLFGGQGYDANSDVGILNDLWKYTPSSNQWTWIKGSNARNQTGVYGTQNVAAATNTPGSRRLGTTWTDATGNLWLFGGYNDPSGGGLGKMNDLWKFDPTNNLWTWIKGSYLADQTGIYGTISIPDAANTPGSRGNSYKWVDKSGNLCMFGGGGYGATGGAGALNDLWKLVLNTSIPNAVNSPATFQGTLSPNPTTSYAELRLNRGIGETVRIVVIDVLGRVVDTRQSESEIVRIGERLEPGVYQLRITTGSALINIRLVKN